MLHMIGPIRAIQIPQCGLYSDCDGAVESNGGDPFSIDEFRMYDFKVRRCARARAHDWTDCPYAHPGEKARRRDPRRFHYAGTPCPEFKREGHCDRGDGCEFAHGVFECWLHPTRYRTQACKDGVDCRRRVCFFAHTPEQLRVVSPKKSSSVDSYDGSPMRMMKNGVAVGGALVDLSPKSILAPWAEYDISPPVSPDGTLAMMMRRMSLCGRGDADGGSFGFTKSVPTTPKAVERENNHESFDGLDVGWISELVK